MMKTVFLLLCLSVVLVSCEIKPDGYKNGKPYILRSNCVKQHTESKYGYHYGVSFRGKFEGHYGLYTETVCDSSVVDTNYID